jgi:hypothetical protein
MLSRLKVVLALMILNGVAIDFYTLNQICRIWQYSNDSEWLYQKMKNKMA